MKTHEAENLKYGAVLENDFGRPYKVVGIRRGKRWATMWEFLQGKEDSDGTLKGSSQFLCIDVIPLDINHVTHPSQIYYDQIDRFTLRRKK